MVYSKYTTVYGENEFRTYLWSLVYFHFFEACFKNAF